jgi:cytochrome c biogenesis protein CcdA
LSIILFSLSISLFDSLSTTLQIIVFVLLLTSARPVRNALCYLAGLIGVYFACGITGFLAFDHVRVYLSKSKLLPSIKHISDPSYYQSEFITGIVMVAIGIWYFHKKRHARPDRVQNMIMLKLQSMNGLFVFVIGVFISITSFPFSIPYLVALGKYTSNHLGLPAAIGSIVVYNFGYALPMIVILVIYLIARRGTDDFKDTLHEKVRVLNVQLITWALAGFGLFLMIDASCYFAIGHALVKGRCF